ncbi:Zinc finger, CCHC-type superfamily [Sesbania bispinosa]|nr:Zinc finger, CCHC-type superfamily [Sesbania bispinosa]
MLWANNITYKRESYELCYGQTISPINGQDMWPKVEGPQIFPPTYKQGPGSPKNLRRREPDEDPNPSRLKRSHTRYACGNCHQFGHNTRKCKNRPTSGEPSQLENIVVPQGGVPPQPQPQSAVSESGGPPQAQSAANKEGPPKVKKIAEQANAQPATVQDKPPENASQSSNIYENIGILRNAHNTMMEVTSSNGYDWLKVESQLGFTNIEAYMTFMQKVDEAKKLCAPVIAAAGDCEGGGTQEFEVTTAKHGPLIQPRNSQK